MARSHGVPACNEAPNSISTVVSDSGDLTAELMGTAPPSKLTIGVYPGGLATIDPSVPPPDEFDCIGGTDCVVELVGTTATVALGGLWPAGSDKAVFVVSAAYFDIDDQDLPFAHAISWAFKVTPAL